jgi:hypothetical protein
MSRKPAGVTMPNVPIQVDRSPMTVRCYGKDDALVCTLVIDGTGVCYYPRNARDERPLHSLTWEEFARIMEQVPATPPK